MIAPDTKKAIDNMDYEVMLRLVRFAPSGDSMFIGDTGEYFIQVMEEKGSRLPPGMKAVISKKIGW